MGRELNCLRLVVQQGAVVALKFPIPTPLLKRICTSPGAPIAIAVCPDFQWEQWRCKKLADHIFDWLPDVAFRPAEREALLFEPHKQIAQACKRFFKPDAEKRGEIGEVLLHAMCRQEFGTISFVARLFYKMRTNDSITSVDVAHLLYDSGTQDIELWLGEAKLYDDLDQAKYRAIKSVEALWTEEFLTEMKALIGPKVESTAPYHDKLEWLFADETSLDHIVDRLVIPFCLAVDFDPTKEATARTTEYVEEVCKTLMQLRDYLRHRVPAKIKIVCIFIPLDCKSTLEAAVAAKVQSFL